MILNNTITKHLEDKTMSKLYTEEQVKQMIDDAHNGIDGYYDIFKKHTPIIQLPIDKTTRFEVIDGSGRRLVEYGVNIEISMQDDGRTMKVFLTKIKGGQE